MTMPRSLLQLHVLTEVCNLCCSCNSSCSPSSRMTSSGSSLCHETSGSWSSSGEESMVLRSGFCYEAPPEPSLDSPRFSASLRCPPASPAGGSNLWLLQQPSFILRSTDGRILQRQGADLLSSTQLETLYISVSILKLIFVH